MTRRLTRVSVHQASLVVAICGAIVGAVVVFVAIPFTMMTSPGEGGGAIGAATLLLLPAMYLVFGYLATAFWLLLFNVVATRLGGIELHFAEPPPAPRPPPVEPTGY